MEKKLMTEKTLSGSCLCGLIQYEVEGTPLRFVHCHCSRCRKATGTGHATNLILKPGIVDWKKSEREINHYKVPNAERFSTTFCKVCGGPLPRQLEGRVIIPAGSLDTVPEIKPQGRIFWGSRTEWSCTAGALPTFEEYPS